MIDPKSSGIQPNTLKPTNSRLKVDSEKKSDGNIESTLNAQTNISDELEFSSKRIQKKEREAPEDPIGDDGQAGEVVFFTGNQIGQNADLALHAQANLNPDKVLELIA